jgi:tetratricopeptide (TPR) repeat protein
VRAIALHELASLYLYRDELGQAQRFYRQGLRLCLWGLPVYHDEAAANLIGLATISQARYLPARIKRLASRALREARLANDGRHVIAAKRLIAVASAYLGRYDEAELYIQDGTALCEEFDAPLEKVRLLLFQGWLQYNRATLREELPTAAKVYFEEALHAAQCIHHLYGVVEAKLGLGVCALAEGATGEAGKSYEAITKALPEAGYPELQAGIKLGLAAVTHQRGELEAAGRFYEEVISFCNQHDIRMAKCKAMIGLGAVHWHLDRSEEAEKMWQRALQSAPQISEVARPLVEISIKLCRADSRVTPR